MSFQIFSKSSQSGRLKFTVYTVSVAMALEKLCTCSSIYVVCCYGGYWAGKEKVELLGLLTLLADVGSVEHYIKIVCRI